MDEVKVKKVIYSSKARRGSGTAADPVRVIEEIFELDGNLIMECDPECKFNKMDLYSFYVYLLRTEASGNKLVEMDFEGLFNGYMEFRNKTSY